MTSEAIITIRRNSDGETRQVKYDLSLVDGTLLGAETVEYMWMDGGGYSCDCNLHIFFEEAGGRELESYEHGCGEGDYSVLTIVMPDGEIIESEK